MPIRRLTPTLLTPTLILTLTRSKAEARLAYQEALRLDPTNMIVKRALDGLDAPEPPPEKATS